MLKIDTDNKPLWLAEGPDDPELPLDLTRVLLGHLREESDTLWEIISLHQEGMIDNEPCRLLLRPAVDLMNAVGATMTAHPAKGEISLDRAEDVGLPTWALHAMELNYDLIVMWWRSSPSALLVCKACGAIKLTGKRTKDRPCHRSPLCTGRLEPLDLPWTSKRPTARKAK
jgi:hypothetical protein